MKPLELQEPEFVVVVIHYRAPQLILRILQNISQWTLKPAQVLIAENSPIDSEILEEIPLPFAVTRLSLEANVGYGAAVNAAFRWYTSFEGPILILTQDAMLENDAAELLLRHFSESSLAIAAPVLVHPEDSTQIFSMGGKLSRFGLTWHRKRPLNAPGELHIVDWADGACLLVDSAFFRLVGGFDEDYFLYVEEVDFQLRIRRAGGRVGVVLSARASQTPGNYDVFLRYRNHMLLTYKNRDSLRPWPWVLVLMLDLARLIILGRRFNFREAFRGMLSARRFVSRADTLGNSQRRATG